MTIKVKSSIQEAAKVFGDAIEGDYRARGVMKELVTSGYSAGLREAISTTDLSAAFNRSIVQKLVAQYPEQPRVWTKVAKLNILEDFKPAFFREFDYDNDMLVKENAGIAVPSGSLARVPELTEYPTFKFSTSANQIQLYKHGARLPFSWEAVINDEWGFIQSIPGEMIRKALNTEETEAFGAFVAPTGPRADVFAGATAADNKPLTFDNLAGAKALVRARKVNGRAVAVPKFALVVPTALEEVAKQILSITTYELTDGNKKYTQTAGNGDIELVVAPALTSIDKSAKASSTWYLVPAGGTDGVRDSILLSFLRNHERPELRVSGNTGTYVGGGNVPSLEGSLLNDDVEYRVRHVVAGGTHYTDAMYASVPA